MTATLRRRRFILATSAFAALTLILSGCSSSDDSASGANCDAYEAYQGNDGSEIEIYSSIRSPEAEIYQESFAEFEECTGITINWNGTAEFEAQLPVRVEGGTAPDLAVFPQPGLLKAMVATGKMVPASDDVSAAADEYYGADWKAYGTVDGTF
ncbi:MAG: extracellular solute-binding protein, partial [Candidatus Nanopelagicaceae bacterium]